MLTSAAAGEENNFDDEESFRKLVAQSKEECGHFVPFLLKSFFTPTEIIACDPAAMAQTMIALSPSLPCQFHFEPVQYNTKAMDMVHPTFKRLVPHVRTNPIIAGLLLENEKVKWKIRLSPSGKFLHRNRYTRRAVVNILHGNQWWLLVDFTSERMNEFLGAFQNDNWNGFRCKNFPTMLSVAEMQKIQEKAHSLGVQAEMFQLYPGDSLVINGQWWHGTSYDSPVLSVFLSGGADAKVGLREHERRMKLPMQKNLDVGKLKMAKVSQLDKNGSGTWEKDVHSKSIDWNNA